MLAAWPVPLLIAAAGVRGAPPDEGKLPLPQRTVWADTGMSAIAGKPSAQQIENLCKTPAMSLEKNADGSLVQTFYAGIAMSTRYAPVKTVSNGSAFTLYLYEEAGGKAAETLEFAAGGRSLVQKSSHFRPHAYVRCYRWEAATPMRKK